jgi:hypothetical protein
MLHPTQKIYCSTPTKIFSTDNPFPASNRSPSILDKLTRKNVILPL